MSRSQLRWIKYLLAGALKLPTLLIDAYNGFQEKESDFKKELKNLRTILGLVILTGRL